MLLLAAMFALSLLAATGILILHRRPNWWWTLVTIPPSIGVLYYYLILFLDPNVPENQMPGDILTAVFRPALAWILLVSSLFVLQSAIGEWLRARGGE